MFVIGACGVSDTDMRILGGQWPEPLSWPLTPGHEAAGVIEEIGSDLIEDSLGNRLKPGSKVLVPALIPCLRCQVCLHHPDLAALCLRPTYLGRSVGFAQPPHLWGGWADMGYVDCEANPGARLYQLPDDMPIWLGSLVEPFTTATARATFPPAFRCCIGRVGVIRS